MSEDRLDKIENKLDNLEKGISTIKDALLGTEFNQDGLIKQIQDNSDMIETNAEGIAKLDEKRRKRVYMVAGGTTLGGFLAFLLGVYLKAKELF